MKSTIFFAFAALAIAGCGTKSKDSQLESSIPQNIVECTDTINSKNKHFAKLSVSKAMVLTIQESSETARYAIQTSQLKKALLIPVPTVKPAYFCESEAGVTVTVWKDLANIDGLYYSRK
ncbi:MAG: hypothetical protein NTV34_04695 [Proteobacteria bacterium]|nr:hypothetical protein [Pseudomonadota bacterium]